MIGLVISCVSAIVGTLALGLTVWRLVPIARENRRLRSEVETLTKCVIDVSIGRAVELPARVVLCAFNEEQVCVLELEGSRAWPVYRMVGAPHPSRNAAYVAFNEAQDKLREAPPN